MEQSSSPQPPPPPPPPPPTPPPEPSAPGTPKSAHRRGRRAAMVALAGIVVAAAVVAAYFVGRSSANAQGAYERGRAKGEASTSHRFAPGQAGYQRIYQAGFQAGHAQGVAAGQLEGERRGAERGKKVSLDRGQGIGTLQGDPQAIASGADAALGRFGSWKTDAFYIVRLVVGAQGVPYRIEMRGPMDSHQRYAVCASDTGAVCSAPIPKR